MIDRTESIEQSLTEPALKTAASFAEGAVKPPPPPEESDQLAIALQLPFTAATQYRVTAPKSQLVLLPPLLEELAVIVLLELE